MNYAKQLHKKQVILSDEDFLVKHIETLSHSGLPCLDQNIMTKIKRICKKSTGNINTAYQIILRQLKKKHAEVRNSSFQICIELFPKSHAFRELVLKDLELILELTAGINPEVKLPPPKDVSEKLTKLALATLLQWKASYGDAYKQLIICCNYLTHSKGIDFLEIQREADENRRTNELRERQLQQVREESMKKFQGQYDEIVPEVESAVDVVTNCIGLLLPTPDDFFLPADGDSEDVDVFSSAHTAVDRFEPRQFALSHSYSLTITIDTEKKVAIRRTKENSSIIDNMRDNLKTLQKYLPKLKKMIDVCSANSDDNSTVENVNSVIKKIDDCLKKCNEMKVEGIKVDESDSDSEEDLVEVKKEGFEDSVALDLLYGPSTSRRALDEDTKRMECSIKNFVDHSFKRSDIPAPLSSNENAANDSLKMVKPSEVATMNNPKPMASSSSGRKERLLAIAPKLPYDVDLYHWEDEKLTTPTLLSTTMDTPKFWGSGNIDDIDEIPDPRGEAALRTRVIEFTGHFEPVKWSCRVPLLSGKLCPRQDRVKCPFHGKIVPRDKYGKCVQQEDETPTPSCSTKDAESDEEPVPDWQDPQLLAELKAVTGIDLKMPDKKKKKRPKERAACVKKGKKRKEEPNSEVLEAIKKRNFPGLRDVEKGNNNAKVRLRKKIFNRASMRRVAEDIRRLHHRRYHDKFGDQFNYT